MNKFYLKKLFIFLFFVPQTNLYANSITDTKPAQSPQQQLIHFIKNAPFTKFEAPQMSLTEALNVCQYIFPTNGRAKLESYRNSLQRLDVQEEKLSVEQQQLHDNLLILIEIQEKILAKETEQRNSIQFFLPYDSNYQKVNTNALDTITKTQTIFGAAQIWQWLSQDASQEKIQYRQNIISELVNNEELFNLFEKNLYEVKIIEKLLLSYWNPSARSHFYNVAARLNPKNMSYFNAIAHGQSILESMLTLIYFTSHPHEIIKIMEAPLLFTKNIVGALQPLLKILSSQPTHKLLYKCLIVCLKIPTQLKDIKNPVIATGESTGFLFGVLLKLYSYVTFPLLIRDELNYHFNNESVALYHGSAIKEFMKKFRILEDACKKNKSLNLFFENKNNLLQTIHHNNNDVSKAKILNKTKQLKAEAENLKNIDSIKDHLKVLLKTALTLLPEQTKEKLETDTSVLDSENSYNIHHFMIKEHDFLKNILKFIGEIDAYMSLARLIKNSKNSKQKFCLPKIIDEKYPYFNAKKLWNTTLDPDKDTIVTNSIELGTPGKNRGMIITGSNAVGKSHFATAVAQSIFLAKLGIAPAESLEMTYFKSQNIHILAADKDHTSNKNSHSQKIMLNVGEMCSSIKGHSQDFHFTLFDEPFRGSIDPDETVKLLRRIILEKLSPNKNVLPIIVTQFKRPEITDIEQETNGMIKNFHVDAQTDSKGKPLFHSNNSPVSDHVLKKGISQVSTAEELANRLIFNSTTSTSVQ